MSNDSTLSSALDKCRKLASLSTSSNPNEAGLASSRLAEIMMKYQISQIELGRHIGEMDSNSNNSKNTISDKSFYTSTRKSHWKMNIAQGCGKLFNCVAYWMGGDIYLIGRDEDMRLTRYLFDMIIPQVEELCDKSWNVYYTDWLISDDSFNELTSRKSFSHSFFLSCSRVVRQRLNEKYQQSINSLKQGSNDHTVNCESTSFALMVMDKRRESVMNYIKRIKWGKSIKPPSGTSAHGKVLGESAGKKVRLNQELKSNLPLLKG